MSSTSLPKSSSTNGHGNSTKFIIIIVACVGGFLLVLGLVCIAVPLIRRRVARRNITQRALGFDHEVAPPDRHARNASEAGAPLLAAAKDLALEPYQAHHLHELSDSADDRAAALDYFDPYTVVGAAPRSDSLSRAPAQYGYSTGKPWENPSHDAPPSRPPHASLRRARTRIRAPMAPVPEDTLPPSYPRHPQSPTLLPTSPTSTSISSAAPASPPAAAPENPSWIHIPTPAPLISAFRRSIAASTSSRSTMSARSGRAASPPPPLPTPGVRASDAYTFRSFASGPASSGHGHPSLLEPDSLDHRHAGAASPPPHDHTRLDIPARLRPSGHPERVAQLVPGRPAPGSRAASLLSVSVAGGGATSLGSRSDLSVYTDARSELDGETSELGVRAVR